MSQKRSADALGFIQSIHDQRVSGPRQFTDTDPQMLHAIWLMEFGHDPDVTLSEVENAIVEFDKFAPGVSKR